MSRADVTAAIESIGVVAVIRMKDPARLRAVVDALAEEKGPLYQATRKLMKLDK